MKNNKINWRFRNILFSKCLAFCHKIYVNKLKTLNKIAFLTYVLLNIYIILLHIFKIIFFEINYKSVGNYK